VLVALQHAELKEMGVNSVGHRLTILKAVYEIKVKQNVPIEPDDYVPLCKCYLHPTRRDADYHDSCGYVRTRSAAHTR
jgi:hypothetical protein